MGKVMRMYTKMAVGMGVYVAAFCMIRLADVFLEWCVEKFVLADCFLARLLSQGGVFISVLLMLIVTFALFLTISISAFHDRHESKVNKMMTVTFSCLCSGIFVYAALLMQSLFTDGLAYWWKGVNATCVSVIWIVDSVSIMAINWIFALLSPFMVFIMAKLGSVVDEMEK